MTRILGFLGLFLLLNSFVFAQKKKFQSYNTFIQSINERVDYINQEQQKLQQYHQDIFRYYRIFDTLTVSPYEKQNTSFEKVVPPSFSEEAYLTLETQFVRFDSLIAQIDFIDDLRYSQGKIDSMNARVLMIQKISNDLQRHIESVELSFSKQSLETKKKAYQLMRAELNKVSFLVKKFKRRKLELHEIEYTIPTKVRRQLPAKYLHILEEFQSRLSLCKEGGNKEDIIHYFLPERYFDKWILSKYSERYWQVKYLEDLIINPVFEQGLVTNYNTEVENFSLQSLKSVDAYNSIPFEYVPPTKSPFGRHKKIFVILILDISNSMNEFHKLDQLKESVKTFIDALRPQDKFSIILFSNLSQELILPGEKDTEYMKYLVDQIKAYGNTKPESAIFRAYNIMNLQTNKEYDNQVLLVTDGVFEVTGKMKYHINLGKKKDITFSIINIENGGENFQELKKLTSISDGKMYFISDDRTYETLVEEILRK